jgi:hypothetical protein
MNESHQPSAPRSGAAGIPSNRAAGALVVALALSACALTARSLYVDYLCDRRSPESYQRAAAIDGGRADVYRGLANLDSTNRRDYLTRAVSLEPYDAGSLIELGLLDEAAANRSGAERWLLHAAQADGTYLPTWTLTNYYFRQSNTAAFWKWARRAAEMCPQEFTPLFRLCFMATGDAAEVERRVVRGRPLAERRFLHFLAYSGRLPEAAELMQQHSQRLIKNQSDAAEMFVARAIETGYIREARRVWDAMGTLGLTPFPPATPGHGGYLTNGSFDEPISGKGFDWRDYPGPGCGVFRDSAPTQTGGNTVRLELTGDSPYRKMLEQHLVLPPGRRLRLSWRYRASGLGPAAQLAVVFRFDGVAGSRLERMQLDNADGWKRQSWAFSTPPEFKTSRIALVHTSHGLQLSPTIAEMGDFELIDDPAAPKTN